MHLHIEVDGHRLLNSVKMIGP